MPFAQTPKLHTYMCPADLPQEDDLPFCPIGQPLSLQMIFPLIRVLAEHASLRQSTSPLEVLTHVTEVCRASVTHL